MLIFNELFFSLIRKLKDYRQCVQKSDNFHFEIENKKSTFARTTPG
ncbi:hypothetical protein NC99_44890 [Sunxiuqinia dokdonensis]|uniref:Uncharacterized protein n=1 Tax=Sunxiuqinia dokdonensis TaxID=1409788 RepID=A0A0L8V2T2_9BACT|nr:hypothetical protein NC99_44890 [Sunxiuqinia dokdonensis]